MTQSKMLGEFERKMLIENPKRTSMKNKELAKNLAMSFSRSMSDDSDGSEESGSEQSGTSESSS